MAAFVKPGERIGLKPNIILPSSPDRAICTHPLLVAAVALAVREAGGYPVVVESPGAGVVPLKSVMVGVFRKAGYREAADRYGFELSYDTDWEVVSHPEGRAVHRVELLSSAPGLRRAHQPSKFKTHTFQVLSGATKNLFGLIPGLTKVGYHAKLADPRRFGDMLLDVGSVLRPRLNIVDAILAMEGQGPSTSGTPRQVGASARRSRFCGRRPRLLRHRRDRPRRRAGARRGTRPRAWGGRPDDTRHRRRPARGTGCEGFRPAGQVSGEDRAREDGIPCRRSAFVAAQRLLPAAAAPGGPLYRLRRLRAGLPG